MNRETEKRALAEIERDRQRREDRDTFALAALVGVLASTTAEDVIRPASVAGLAYEIADAMLLARGETP